MSISNFMGVDGCGGKTAAVGTVARSRTMLGLRLRLLGKLLLILVLAPTISWAMEFGIAENSIGEFRALRYENMYTKVPTSGKLVSIKITDAGRIYYVCRERNGFAIYHLEIRPLPEFKDKFEQDLKEWAKKWDGIQPDDLLLTKERNDSDLKRKLQKYCEAVWIRNEIVLEEPPKP